MDLKIEKARVALSDMDDCSRMAVGINPVGARAVIETFINDAERIVQTLASKDAEIAGLKEDLQFVERQANHHGQKPHVTANEALSCIQHYPAILAITRSYVDGKVPKTYNPYAEIARLREALEFGVDLYDDHQSSWQLGMSLYEWTNVARNALTQPPKD